jgi:hypothetical protein
MRTAVNQRRTLTHLISRINSSRVWGKKECSVTYSACNLDPKEKKEWAFYIHILNENTLRSKFDAYSHASPHQTRKAALPALGFALWIVAIPAIAVTKYVPCYAKRRCALISGRRRTPMRISTTVTSLLAGAAMVLSNAGGAAAAPPVPPPADQISADCKAATYATDQLVCSDPTLLALDTEMARLWARVEAEGRLDSDGRSAQMSWFRQRSLCAFDGDHRGCAIAAYRARIAALLALIGAP